jgi:hypothetical protein
MLYDLAALRQCAQDAVDAAEADPGSRHDAVNWADLDCVGAEHYTGDDGGEGFRVWIEEADPGAWRLREFVANYLAARGFAGVDIMTEW